MANLSKTLTAAEIRSAFYQGQITSAVGESGAPPRAALTPSARYVVKEARKWMQSQPGSDEPDEGQLIDVIKSVEKSEGEELSERERDAALASLKAAFADFDVLSPLLQNSDINDIIVRSFDDISVQSGRKNIQTDIRFADHARYKSFVENLLKRAGKTCTLATPVVDAALESSIRICVTHESFSPPGSGPMLTIRVARHGQISLDRLAHYGVAPAIVFEYLSAVVRSGLGTLLVAGEVGTGKTTLVRALASQIGSDESILIIEDTNEIALQRRFVRTLLTREANTEGAGKISPAQAIRAGMRMAMNRIILGEMRDAETAEAFIDVCASGHPGMSTIHARNARDALSRLELFLLRAQGNVGVETVRRQIANAISLVIFLDVEQPSGARRIRAILEVDGASEGEIQVIPVFSLQSRDGEPGWVRDGGISMFGEVLRTARVHLPAPGTFIAAVRGEQV